MLLIIILPKTSYNTVIPTTDVIKAHNGKLFGERSQHKYIWGTFMNIFISSKDIFFIGEVNWGKTSTFLISIRN